MSPSSLRPTRWASVPPIWPAPISAILLRAMWGKPSNSGGGIGLGKGPLRCVIAPIGAAVQVAGARSLATYGPYGHSWSLMVILAASASGFHDPSLCRQAGGRIPPATRQGQIGLRAHLDQTGGGPLEFPRLEAVLGAVEHVGLGLGGGQKLQPVVVERVDQDDEALGFVASLVVHDRDAIDDEGVEFAGDLEISGRRQRLLAELVKAEARHTLGAARAAQRATEPPQRLSGARLTA